MVAARGWIWSGLAAFLVGGALVIALALPDSGRGATETPIDSFTLPANASPVTSSATVTAGQKYKLIVSGTFVVETVGADFSHDAIYCFAASTGPLCNPPEEFGEKLFVGYASGSLNGFPGALGASTPAYSSSHSYAVTFTATQTAKLRFFVSNPDGRTITGSLAISLLRVTDSPPTGCTSQVKPVCIKNNPDPYLFKVRHPQVSKSRNEWNKAKVTFNLAPADYADAASPLISPRQKKAIIDVSGLGNDGVAVVADPKFRNFARLSCVAAANAHAAKLLEQFKQGGITSGSPEVDLKAIQLGVLRQLEFCLELVDRMLDRQAKAGSATAGARAAAAGCSPARVPIQVGAAAGGRRRGKAVQTKVAAQLRITCKKIKGGQRLTLRPKSRKAKLRSILGKRLHVGLLRASIAKRNGDIGVRFKR